MTDRQTRTQNMAGTTQEVLDTNQSLWDTIPAIVAKHAALGNNLVTIRTIQGIQENDSTGLRVLKLLKKRTMASLARNILGPMAAWARDNEFFEVLEEIDLSFSNLFYVKDSTAIERCQKVLERATTHIAELAEYGILPNALPPLQDAITQFIDLKDTPRQGITVKEAATAALAQEFTTLRNVLIGLDDLLQPFSATNPTFYNEYTNARKIVNTGGRKVTLKGYVTDAENGAVIVGATVTLRLRELVATSGKTGYYSFKSLESGSEDVLFQHPDYDDQLVEGVSIEADNSLSLDVQLNRNRS